MAESRQQKPRYPDAALQDDCLAKSQKRRADEDEPSRNHHPAITPRIDKPSQDRSKRDLATWVYPPEFWDRLSEIPVIHTAVAELDRRNNAQPSPPQPPPLPPSLMGLVQDLARAPTKELARFARHGGPSLVDLRGYPVIEDSNPPADAMSSSPESGNTKPTEEAKITDPTTKTKTTSPYNRAFEQHLTDFGIHPIWKSLKPNLDDIRAALAVPRESLSLSQFSENAFQAFQAENYQARYEEDVKAFVVPAILGPKQIDHPLGLNTLFGNLDPLTDFTLAAAKPDVYYGAYPAQLNRNVRDELRGHIMPSTMEDNPIVPNFFLELKGPEGSAGVAMRQSRYNGALGARAMHSLQNYGSDKPVFDGSAYAFSSTYYDGALKLFAHHLTAPVTPVEKPEYHMTQLRSFTLIDNRKDFVEGVTAFRNARDLAGRYRQAFIAAANAKAG
ncbi:hypothetical protein SAMD00023353_0105320 [Rosellinia necatrix]|uniref:DUF7924 domain-containing protein n=1 Tax=Rosellinia necatrix TaxID=77044 RepID=A0A1S7UIF5_ROSNE|nr:hypothetical protein SAMD00023353_0105320 [Rosellinia necatrix]